MPTGTERANAVGAAHGRPLALDDARARIVELAAARALGGETLAIELALGRVLADDVVARGR